MINPSDFDWVAARVMARAALRATRHASRKPTLPGEDNLKDAPAPPAKPAGMSEDQYRNQYDSSPTTVIAVDGTIYRCCGPVSAHIVARGKPGARVIKGHHSYR
jgi:hypothetical protein